MKIKSFFAIAAMASLFASCAQEEFEFYGPQTGKIVATMENPTETRTNVTDQGYFTWVTGDQISIHTDGGFILGSLSEGNGTPQGAFTYSYTGEAPSLDGYAVYPYNSSHEISDGTLTFVMPSEYNLGTNTSNTNVAMLASPGVAKGQSQSFSFSHLAGAFRISFKNAPAGASKLEFSLGGKKINGTFSVSLDEPAINTADTETEAEKTTTLNFTPLAETQDLVLYVPAPVGEYVGINAKLYKEDGTLLGEWGKATTQVTVNKRSLKLMTEINFGGVSGDIENNQQVASEAQLKAAIANGGIITLTDDITLTSYLTTTENVTVNLNGHNITANGVPFYVTGGTLTLEGEGTVKGSSNNSMAQPAVWAATNGNVIINGGTYTVGTDANGNTNDCILANGGTITIN
ncbi:MAG: hypothetical protein IKU98_05260, partial [Bacteroidaceae bacterium]|nr:hypothetical protein [Bacteroidaceae bacterium]